MTPKVSLSQLEPRPENNYRSSSKAVSETGEPVNELPSPLGYVNGSSGTGGGAGQDSDGESRTEQPPVLTQDTDD
jgi:hypothetical protein